MIDALYMKKDIRRFLDNFSKDQWENILPCLVRIGIEYLKRNFDTVNFTAKDFKNVISKFKINPLR